MFDIGDSVGRTCAGLTRRDVLQLGAMGAVAAMLPGVAFAKDKKIKVAAIFATPIEEPWDNQIHVALQKAEKELVKLGKSALSDLKEAAHDRDIEVSRRAQRCIEAIEQGTEAPVLVSAAYLLGVRRPRGAVPVLLAYLPSAGEEMVVDVVQAALLKGGLADGKADADVVKALKDREWRRRAAAAGEDQVLRPLFDQPVRR